MKWQEEYFIHFFIKDHRPGTYLGGNITFISGGRSAS